MTIYTSGFIFSAHFGTCSKHVVCVCVSLSLSVCVCVCVCVCVSERENVCVCCYYHVCVCGLSHCSVVIIPFQANTDPPCPLPIRTQLSYTLPHFNHISHVPITPPPPPPTPPRPQPAERDRTTH